MPPVLGAHSVVMQNDPRRFSEASILPPPRPPPPRINNRSQRRPAAHPVPPTMWPPQVAAQAQPQTPSQQPAPLQVTGGSNLAKMGHMARSTPQLDDFSDSREHSRELVKTHFQSSRDSVVSQVRHRDVGAVLINEFCGPQGGVVVTLAKACHSKKVVGSVPRASWVLSVEFASPRCFWWVLSMFYQCHLGSLHVLLASNGFSTCSPCFCWVLSIFSLFGWFYPCSPCTCWVLSMFSLFLLHSIHVLIVSVWLSPCSLCFYWFFPCSTGFPLCSLCFYLGSLLVLIVSIGFSRHFPCF